MVSSEGGAMLLPMLAVTEWVRTPRAYVCLCVFVACITVGPKLGNFAAFRKRVARFVRSEKRGRAHVCTVIYGLMTCIRRRGTLEMQICATVTVLLHIHVTV